VTLHPNRFGFLLLLACLLAVPSCFANDSDSVRIPLTFEQNQGQTEPEVRFLARSGARTVFLTDRAAVLTSHTGDATTSVTMSLQGAASVNPRGESKTGGFANYYGTQDTANWKSNIPLFGAVRYPDVYPGIDAIFHASKEELEFDFEIQPGSSPAKVQLDFSGADRISIAADGGLDVVSEGQTWHLVAPVAYQGKGSLRKPVLAKYRLTSDKTVSFEVGEFDSSSTLIIDPVVQYASTLTANNGIVVAGIGTDAAGDLFLAGETYSTTYPVVNGSGRSSGGTQQVYVTKINPAGDTILYSTYIPSSNFSSATGMVVDANGNVYVIGVTMAQDFPLTSTNLGTCSSQFCNAGFVLKLSPTGAMTYSTLLGTGQILPYAITVDSGGSAYVAGGADNTLQPVNPFQTTPGNAFFAKLNAAGTNYAFSSFFGGTSFQGPAKGIALDASGNVFIAGITAQDPPLVKPWQSGNGNLFLAKFAGDGKTLLFSTRLGSSGPSVVMPDFVTLTGITIGMDGTVYLVGSEAGPDYPYSLTAVSHPLGGTGGSNMFVTAIDPSLTKLTYSTYLGDGFANAFALDSANHLHVAGSAALNTPPIKNAIDLKPIGPGDGFFMELDPTGTPVTVSKFGGEYSPQVPTGVAVDPSNNVYLAGGFSQSSTSYLPADYITVGPGFGLTTSSYSSFVAKITNSAGPQISLATTGPVVSVRNVGSADLHISSVTLGGNLGKRWGNCPSTVPAGSSCFITVTDANGNFATGTVTINSDAQPAAQSISVAPYQPIGSALLDLLYFQDTFVQYPAQQQDTSTAAYPLSLWNIGAAPATINSIGAGGTAAQTNNCGTIAPGTSCTIQVSLTPGSGGVGGNINVTYDGNIPLTYSNLYVTMSTQQLLLSTNSIEFGTQQVGGIAIPRTVTVTNTGNAAASVPTPSITGDTEFVVAGNTCTAALAPHQSCVLAAQFNPNIAGTPTANLNIAGQQVALDGQGQIGSTVQISPLELDYPPIPVGSSFPMTLTLTNTSATPATIAGVSLSLGDYTEQDTCQGQVPGNGTCVMNVSFAPTQLGARNAQMSVTFGGSVISQVLTLTGSGVTPLTVQGTSLDFGATTVVGSTSAVQFVELGNGGPTVIPYSVSVSGDFNAVNTCPVPFPKFLGCPVNVTFQPKKVGARTGQLVVSYPGISVQNVVTLTGTAPPQFTAGAASGSSLTTIVKSGATANYQLAFTGAPGFTGQVQVTCTGAPKSATCTAQPTSVSIPASGSVSVAISVTTTAAASTSELKDLAGRFVWAILLMPALFRIRRRARVLAFLMCLALAGSSCGGGGGSGAGGGSGSGGGSNPPPPPPTASTTPAGTYMLQVNAVGGLTTQTVQLTLVVQ